MIVIWLKWRLSCLNLTKKLNQNANRKFWSLSELQLILVSKFWIISKINTYGISWKMHLPHPFWAFHNTRIFSFGATSMLATDVGDEICWRQLWDVGDGFGRFCHQHTLSFSISVRHQHLEDITNIKILLPTSESCHQQIVINIHLSPTSL